MNPLIKYRVSSKKTLIETAANMKFWIWKLYVLFLLTKTLELCLAKQFLSNRNRTMHLKSLKKLFRIKSSKIVYEILRNQLIHMEIVAPLAHGGYILIYAGNTYISLSKTKEFFLTNTLRYNFFTDWYKKRYIKPKLSVDVDRKRIKQKRNRIM